MEQQQTSPLRTAVMILAFVLIWWGWQQYLAKKYPTPPASTVKQNETTQRSDHPAAFEPKQSGAPAAVSAGKAHARQALEAKSEPEKFWNYEDDTFKVTVSSVGGRITQLALKKYTDKGGSPVQLISSDKSEGYMILQAKGQNRSVDFSKSTFDLKPLSSHEIELTASKDGLTVKRKLEVVPDQYTVKAHTTVEGNLDGIQSVDVQVSEPAPRPEDGTPSRFAPAAGGVLQEYFISHGTKTDRVRVSPKDSVDKSFEQTHFASVGSRYFTTLLFNRGNVLPVAEAHSSGDTSILRFAYPVLDAKAPVNLNFDLFAGPKVLDQLKLVDETAAQVVDFGTFSWIAKPLLDLMKLFFQLFKNWGIAIIALTILVRGVTFPFTYMSYKSMKAMQKIQPEIQRLKEVYKSDTQRLNQEMMKLMRDNKVNPMGGCLPMLLQLPIFWALYQVLQNSIELYHSPFAFWIHDLSMKDPYYVLPILMGVTMLVQQKMTPSTMDPAQAKVMLIMPIFFSFLMMSLPAGLTLYIFISTLFGIFQQLLMMRDRQAAGHAVMRRS